MERDPVPSPQCVDQATPRAKRPRDPTPPSILDLLSAPTTRTKRPRSSSALDVADCITHLPSVLTNSEARDATAKLRQEIKTTQGQVRVYGKVLNEARLTAYYVRRQWADPRLADRPYVYSGKTITNADDFPPTIEMLCARVEDALGKPRGTYTAVLINEYRDGADYISWHSDDERSINRTDIASLSLGATRDFKVRAKADHTRQTTFALESGDLLHMHSACQDLYQHHVPKRARVAGVRFNLTFRRLADNGTRS
ncbi:Dioxygenase [Pandoravirus macleodensis]|uniref:Dioxygenase n=1 Tax=Pandoravirus macleodensis TaxID=2107707 RepID=A0A2U7UFY6_9VIRU|nr:alkylated DNA repair [Pandoravirus macleodensis]AVK77342.1 Dioxygenase [Pandoravirus macleodensis]UMO80100.1 Dioxygenase [Pandoravirus aubagnensis]